MAALSFDLLRSWDGSQHRAFEELTFQLLREKTPNGTRAVRTGNPDGGVEWYATLPDGSEWGWQAKHVKGIDALLTAMTTSVKRVAAERPQLRRLTFVISWNLATGTIGRERKSQREKYEDKITAWKKNIAGAAQIEFDLVQESELLNELAKPEHQGRVWFWWGNLVLGPAWLETRLREQADAAGQKYRPDLQVDLPIQDDLLALGFDATTQAVFGQYRQRILSAIEDLHLVAKGRSMAATLYREMKAKTESLRLATAALAIDAGDPPGILDAFTREVEGWHSARRAAVRHEDELREQWRALPKDDPNRGAEPRREADDYDVRRLAEAINAFEGWLDSSAGQAWARRSYFLTGQAGSGKTHLFLDATRRALDTGRPAVFLAGARFGKGNLWESICDQLGLSPVGGDVLLSAMDSAGEASALCGRRFVIFVDALNETPASDFWLTHLSVLQAAVVRHQHVALAVSCRDTYRDVVIDDETSFDGLGHRRFYERTHPGFAEREVEATHRYFEHYGLEAPKIPLLTPEFTLPLFLRLYCESLVGAGDMRATPGHTGRIEVFERYLKTKVATIARQLRPQATSNYEFGKARDLVRSAIDVLLDELARRGAERMPVQTAESLLEAHAAADAVRLLGIFQNEGILAQERLYLGDEGFGEGVRIVFQAFSDFLLVRRRIGLSDDPLTDDDVRGWLRDDCSWGVVEAATVLLPEVYGVELVDFIEADLGQEPTDGASREEWQRHNRVVSRHKMLVETLPYRTADAVTQRTIDLLNAVQPYMAREEFYNVLFTLAPLPKHRLNGEGLHRYLAQYRMPERDRDFGISTYDAIWDEFGPITRLARWAAGGPYPTYDKRVVEYACIPLCWLLSSPNRFMRDWVTKALVQLLGGHLDVAERLVRRFWEIDDPYVVQRVIVIAYGALMRAAPNSDADARPLVRAVSELVFSEPIRADELMLDAARGILRWGANHKIVSAAALTRSTRPYGLKPPSRPPSEATLEARYWPKDSDSTEEQIPDEESYSTIRWSLFGMGDFGRYVAESGLRHFSRHRIGEPFPERESRQPHVVKGRLKQFRASLAPEQRVAFDSLNLGPNDIARYRWSLRRADFFEGLGEEQRSLLDAAVVYPKPVNDDYPAEAACRWIFRRTLSLGWTPKLFGRFDRQRGHSRGGREAHKAERFGKKYQWMAYHELLARVADNYQSSRLYADEAPYEGLHQIIADREIDPSLPPIDYRAFLEQGGEDTGAWQEAPVQLPGWPTARISFTKYKADIGKFIEDTDSEPALSNLLFACDDEGNEWIALLAHDRQVDPSSAKDWRGLQQSTSLQTVLVASSDAKRLLDARARAGGERIRDIFESPQHTDCCYVGEIGLGFAPRCASRHDELQSLESPGVHFVSPIERYTWEGSLYDCSIGDSASTALPSSFIQGQASLAFDSRGPSWVDSDGAVIFTNLGPSNGRTTALLVRATYLRDLMTTHSLELVVTLWFDRMLLDGNYGSRHAFSQCMIDGRIGSDLALRSRKPVRTGFAP